MSERAHAGSHSELLCSPPQLIDTAANGTGEDEGAEEDAGRRSAGKNQNLEIGVHVEHHEPGEQHRDKRQGNREQGKPSELEP